MKTVTASFATSEAAHAAVEALKDAGIPDADISVGDVENGDTVVSTTVDDGLLDAAAAILNTGDATTIDDSAGFTQPEIEGHPDGSGPVVAPVVPNR